MSPIHYWELQALVEGMIEGVEFLAYNVAIICDESSQSDMILGDGEVCPEIEAQIMIPDSVSLETATE